MTRGEALSVAKRMLYQFAMDGKWTAIKYFYKDNPMEIFSQMTTNKDTALHILASNHGGSSQLKELIELIPEQRKIRQALMMENKDGNTPLHEAAASGNMEAAKLLVNEDKRLSGQEGCSDSSCTPLVEIRNQLGESPLYRAAAFGHTNLVKYFRSEVHDVEQHFKRNDGLSILHTAVIAQNFETALWLQKNYPDLANTKESNGLTSLQLLAQMPNAFEAEFPKSIWWTLIYKCLFDDDNIDRDPPNQNDDLESGSNQPRQYSSSKKITRWRPIRKMLEEMQNQLVLSELTDLLVEKEYSWAGEDSDTRNIGSTFCLLYSKKQVEEDSDNCGCDDGGVFTRFRRKQGETSKSTYKYTPLLTATCTGILQIVKKIINFHPQVIEERDIETQENILHMAIKHRQLAIFNFVKKKKTITSRLAYRIDSDGNSILHHAADTKFYTVDTLRVSGPAFELQEELYWMTRVKKILPLHYSVHQNNQGLTAQKLFENKHAKLLTLAKAWIKETAQSCSTVAALVATVAYAAAFTAPGGNDKHGVPVLRHSPFFVTYFVSDTISLIFSLTSLCTFLSILTSPFEYENFHRSLPFKLHLGFALLFFSLVATTLTFTATVVLLIHHQKMWTTSLIYVVALLPVSVIGSRSFLCMTDFAKV
ncbi:hypothetical protein L3X38_041298 [Prunus dulcis]|uniref:PGG domain-containing protein n=1 Tax=Prunus dulcis TaxID=3755 RepID=A0AAD4USQ9_PRUDU|nr:hypothetical protein L3X38_041298 [Prunus dulcis]